MGREWRHLLPVQCIVEVLASKVHVLQSGPFSFRQGAILVLLSAHQL